MHKFDPGRLRCLRKAKQMTAVELASRLQTSPAQIHRLEKGLRRLTVEVLIDYCAALGVNPGSLLSANVWVPVTGVIDSDFHIQPLPAGAAARTVAPPLVDDMSLVAALRWAASRRFQPMRDHVVFYKQNAAQGVPEFAWNKRCLIRQKDGGQCLGWPIKDGDRAHIDVGNGLVEFSVEIVWASPVIAVMPPFAIDELALPMADSVD